MGASTGVTTSFRNVRNFSQSHNLALTLLGYSLRCSCLLLSTGWQEKPV